MPIELLPLFSTPIYLMDTGVDSFDEETEFLKNINFKPGVFNNLSSNVKLLDLPELSRLKQICEEHLLNYVDTVLNCEQKFYITNSWATKNNKGQHHHVHNHPNSLISGVLYLQVPEKSDIEFHHKCGLKQAFDLSFSIKNYNIFNSDTWFLPVKQGQILLFPSWVRHSVSVHNHNDPRIVLGFNTFAKGTFGDGIYSGDLEI